MNTKLEACDSKKVDNPWRKALNLNWCQLTVKLNHASSSHALRVPGLWFMGDAGIKAMQMNE